VRVRFGDCVLDTDLRQLIRAQAVVPLQPKAFHLLELLVERRPNAISQAELRELLSPGAKHGGTRVASLVNEIRKAIGDEARPNRMVRTVQRFGYAFCGVAVEELPRESRATPSGFALQWGMEEIALQNGENVIGRAADALISVASTKVSRRHARILIAEGRATLEDLGSKNGTYVDERRLEGPVVLEGGEHITIGPVLLILRACDADNLLTGSGD